MSTTPDYRQQWQDSNFRKVNNGYLYFAFINLLAGTAILFGITKLENVQALDLLNIPATLLAINFFEWLLHHGPMHRKRFYFKRIYRDHAQMHHTYFPHTDMAARSHKEWGYVLVPFYALVGIICITTPLAWLASGYVPQNHAWIVYSTAIGYYLLYEWCHLAYHLPDDHPIGKLPIIRALRQHHHTHHNQRLMRDWNFNVTFPIADYVLGTAYKGKDAEE